jgi:hypothetical protein
VPVCPRVRRVFRGLLIAAVALVLAVGAAAASADEPLPKGDEGAFELHGTNGYEVHGLIASTGTSGVLLLFVGKPGAEATYQARGEVTREHVRFDLGRLGEIDLAVQPIGRMETVRPACGKPVTVEGQEYVGTIAFHGEEGFTDAEASRAPLELKPILDLVCGGAPESDTLSSGRLPGVQLNIAHKGGPSLRLDQNHPGARVFYEAHLSEKMGAIRVSRAVEGHLGGGALHYAPSLATATFSAATPFSGTATYSGKRPPRQARPGNGTWSGNLKVDFPGHAAVLLAGPSFTASIVHAKRTESRR